MQHTLVNLPLINRIQSASKQYRFLNRTTTVGRYAYLTGLFNLTADYGRKENTINMNKQTTNQSKETEIMNQEQATIRVRALTNVSKPSNRLYYRSTFDDISGVLKNAKRYVKIRNG